MGTRAGDAMPEGDAAGAGRGDAVLAPDAVGAGPGEAMQGRDAAGAEMGVAMPRPDAADDERGDAVLRPAAHPSKVRVVEEAADVMYFLTVALESAGVSVADVERELDRRSMKVGRRAASAPKGAADG